MKKLSYNLLLCLLVGAFGLSSCSKDDSSSDGSGSSVKTAPTFSDAGGSLIAVKTITYVTAAGMEIPTELNTAVAAFYDSPGSEQFTDAGAVSINSLAMKKYDNNSYSYDDYLNPLDLSQIKWEVAGKGSVPAISKTVTQPMPNYSGYSSLPSCDFKSRWFYPEL